MSSPRQQQPTLAHSSQDDSSHATDESRQEFSETESVQLEPSRIASQAPSLYEISGLDEPWLQEFSSPQSTEQELLMAQYDQYPEICENVWQESYSPQWHDSFNVHQEHQDQIQHPYNATTSQGSLSGGTMAPVHGLRSPPYISHDVYQLRISLEVQTIEATAYERSPSNEATRVSERGLRNPRNEAIRVSELGLRRRPYIPQHVNQMQTYLGAQTNTASAYERRPSNEAIRVSEHDAPTPNNTYRTSGVFYCNYDCQKSYRHKSALERHIRTKHVGETLECDICHVRFIGRADVLARHRGNHTV